MIESIKRLLGAKSVGKEHEKGAGSTPDVDPLHLAACVLLLDVAHADGEFSSEERAHLESVLERHFSLPPEAGRALMELAEQERRNAVDHFRYTSQLQRAYDLGQKMVLAEVMWGVVHSDGHLSGHEDYLMTKFSRLLELRPGYLAEAKQRALKK